MEKFAGDVKALLDGLDIGPLPELIDPAVPVDLKLVHAQGLGIVDTADAVRDLGNFTLTLKDVSFPGVQLDPENETLTVDLARLVPDLHFTLGDLKITDVDIDLNADVALKQVATPPGFTTHLVAATLPLAKDISIQDEPVVGDVLEVDTGLSAELRTVAVVTGNGPFEVSFEMPLALAHIAGAPVTRVSTLKAADVDTEESATAVSESYAYRLGTRVLGEVGNLDGKLTSQHPAKISPEKPDTKNIFGGGIGPQPGAATIRLPGLKKVGDTAAKLVVSLTQTVSSVASGLPAGATLSFAWVVKDDSGRVLTDSPEILVVKGSLSGLLNTVESPPLPTVALLPEFVDSGMVGTSVRTISCTVTLEAEGFENHTITIGPRTVRIPRLAVPTVVAMTEHSIGRSDFPGAVLVAIPQQYPIANWDEVKKPLEAVERLLMALKVVMPSLPQNLVDFGFAVSLMLDLLRLPSERLTVLRRNEALDLWWETRWPGWPHNWQDQISSIVMVGAPGRAVSCHNRPNLWSGTGAFRIVLGAMPAAVVSSLWFKASSDSTGEERASIVPSSGKVVVDKAPEKNFNDVLSSFSFK